MMRATWYVLEDGSVADPCEVAPDASGILRHRSGRAVAMRGDAPHSRGVDLETIAGCGGKKPAAGGQSEPEGKDMKPEPPKRRYKTRDAKAG
jgi:hypothetical protein